MRLGVSSYSYARSLQRGALTIFDVVDRVAAAGGEHLEVAAGGFGDDLPRQPELVEQLRGHAAARGIGLANYVIGADFSDPSTVDAEVARVHEHLDVAHRLGVTRFRHDVVPWAWRDADHAEFERVLAQVVPVCRAVAEHAATLGITTMVENHGFAFNDSERILRLVHEVDHPAFRTLLDVGNFVCLDDDPLRAVQRTLPVAAVVHLKDFLVRETPPAADGWLTTLAGRAVLGTVVGHGDLPLGRIVERIVASGFDGPLSIEFEGLEDDVDAVERGLANARSLWAAAGGS
ncbi:sugar phosphate isomerase/epimerase family protein [Curtobacterium citreum]|uniref:sugar phosphate isomerase/epimerase family protein n=1 Tax=Curtobacterium citreum TaxID=2036 RepID=UPI002543759E|nr:sugar phosphate isomerase/epimerase family protein [Curtobacterium citreum]WIJ45961.1 sugar phosphate isomerase/epimerase family protein [Curtobacterium citreum]